MKSLLDPSRATALEIAFSAFDEFWGLGFNVAAF